jgi:hypothetical protein
MSIFDPGKYFNPGMYSLDPKLFRKGPFLITSLAAILKCTDEIGHDSAYKDLLKHKQINIRWIELKEEETVVGPSDCSSAAIQRRIEAGYGDAKGDPRCLAT